MKISRIAAVATGSGEYGKQVKDIPQNARKLKE
jgi:hypothetical protein